MIIVEIRLTDFSEEWKIEFEKEVQRLKRILKMELTSKYIDTIDYSKAKKEYMNQLE